MRHYARPLSSRLQRSSSVLYNPKRIPYRVLEFDMPYSANLHPRSTHVLSLKVGQFFLEGFDNKWLYNSPSVTESESPHSSSVSERDPRIGGASTRGRANYHEWLGEAKVGLPLFTRIVKLGQQRGEFYFATVTTVRPSITRCVENATVNNCMRPFHH